MIAVAYFLLYDCQCFIALSCVHQMLLTYIPRGLGTAIDTALIYKKSLSKLCRIFPNVFYRILANDALIVSLPEIQVPETMFNRNQFKVLTRNTMFPSQKELELMWNETANESGQVKMRHMLSFGHQAKNTTGVPKVVLYPHIAQVGREGLLRRLVMQPKSDSIYSTFLMKALIHSKWKTYGRRLLMKEMWAFAFLWVTFAGYALIIGSTWHISTFEELSKTDSKVRLGHAANGLLFVAWLLGCMGFIREIVKFLNFWIEDGLAGIWYWCRHMFNWIILVSYVLLVAFIGPLHFYMGATGNVEEGEPQTGQKRLTVLVAMESILLSWRIHSFAQAFRYGSGSI